MPSQNRPQIKVIAKIVLSSRQRDKLTQLGAWIASTNPASRTDAKEILSRIGDAEIVLTNIAAPLTSAILAQCPNLKMIQTWSTGVDNIDLKAAKAAGIVVCNVPDFSSDTVAEKTLGMMILSANQFLQAHEHAAAGGWDFIRFVGKELRHKTLVIVGPGRIGGRVAELSKALGMKVVSLNSKSSTEDWAAALGQADFVSLHCPYQPQTHHLFGQKQFDVLKPGAVLINNSRGGVVDERALMHALNSGKVSYATLDVFEKEPPEKDHPLLTHPKVFVTPHFAWNSEESLQRLTDTALQNIESYLQGRPVNQVESV